MLNVFSHSKCLELLVKYRKVKRPACSHQELNPGHLACAVSALSLSYDNQTFKHCSISFDVLGGWRRMFLAKYFMPHYMLVPYFVHIK